MGPNGDSEGCTEGCTEGGKWTEKSLGLPLSWTIDGDTIDRVRHSLRLNATQTTRVYEMLKVRQLLKLVQSDGDEEEDECEDDEGGDGGDDGDDGAWVEELGETAHPACKAFRLLVKRRLHDEDVDQVQAIKEAGERKGKLQELFIEQMHHYRVILKRLQDP